MDEGFLHPCTKPIEILTTCLIVNIPSLIHAYVITLSDVNRYQDYGHYGS